MSRPSPSHGIVPSASGGHVALALVSALLLTACGDAVDESEAVARAGDQILRVDDATALLVDQENLPAEAQVVEALADLWIDYTLLATDIARDSTFGFLDLTPLVRQQLDQEMIVQLRDARIEMDTVVTEEQLQAAFQEQAPGAQLRARHILLTFPQAATQAQRDSVRARMEELRGRVVAGADFAELAREVSQDPGSAAQGGDLGFFSRGDMVRPFEEAVFDLEPGELSEVVQSPYGVHLIRLEERRASGFDEVRDQLRTRLLETRFLSAESTFVAQVEAEADPSVEEGAQELAREIARNPGRTLSGRAAERALGSYEGGAYTTGEFQVFIQGREPAFRQQIAGATDEQLTNFLRGMVQRELLLAEARAAGMEPAQPVVDSLVDGARERLRDVARRIGVLRLDRAPGEEVEPAVQRAVRSALEGILTGASDVVPLGQISLQLRRGEPSQIYGSGVGEVVLRIARARAGRAPAPAEEALPSDSLAGGADEPPN